MGKKCLTILSAALWTVYSAPEANAISNSGTIYIQEDGFGTAVEMIGSTVMYMWKDIAAVCVAFGCTAAMTILAIIQRKRRKP